MRVQGDFRTAPGGDKTIIVDHHPIGVAYLITPWNFPAAMATRKIAPALAAGCTCILKPAAETPLTALWIGRPAPARRRAGRGGQRAADHPSPARSPTSILDDPRVATLSFTGSTPVGKQLMAQHRRAARCRVSMELGGNAPFARARGRRRRPGRRDRARRQDAQRRQRLHRGQPALRARLARRRVRQPAHRRRSPACGWVRAPTAPPSSARWSRSGEQDKVQRLLEVAEREGGRVVQAQDGARRRRVRGARTSSTTSPTAAPSPSTEIFGPVAPIIAFDSVDDGGPDGQRHDLRPDLLRRLRRHRPGHPGRAADGERDGRGQPRRRSPTRPRRSAG